MRYKVIYWHWAEYRDFASASEYDKRENLINTEWKGIFEEDFDLYFHSTTERKIYIISI